VLAASILSLTRRECEGAFAPSGRPSESDRSPEPLELVQHVITECGE
jgi:hypothetical protein